MKVQKMVSLDPETAELAQRMTNFSAFVRQSLRAHAVDADVASEMARRARWARTATILAELCVGYAKVQAEANGEEFNELASELRARIYNQTTLEDFE